ncbi:MAG: T9SS type A sorting domain-containing protein, partial [bacterium]|nr:T9SS type A sorting domain-containing protein [bacterium]
NHPEDFLMMQNFPNPFNPSTQISYALPQASHVVLKIFNLMGQEIKTLVDGLQTAGAHSVSWDGIDSLGKRACSGIYICQLQIGVFLKSKKMLLVE